jgi:UDP-2,4-diacetamido-2,4,6-trideoxy-beta-L-altropyranose hydrolase
LLVFFGGADPGNYTGDVLEALSSRELESLSVDVVLGVNNPHVHSVTNQVRSRPNTQLHIQINNIAALMAKADLFVGALGSVTWERCAVGLPGICIALAENQIPVSNYLSKHDLVLCLDYGSSTPETWLKNIKTLMGHPQKIIRMSSRLSTLVDSRGAGRIADWLMNHNWEVG